MYEPLQMLLLNSFFLIAPLFFIQQIDERPLLKYKNVIAFLSSVCIVMACMTFPIRVSPDFLIDLRWIPLLLTHMYLGYVVSIPLAAATLAYRLLGIGGDGAFMAFVILSVFLIPPKLFARGGWSAMRKTMTGGAFSAGYGLFCTVVLYATGTLHMVESEWVVPLFFIQLLVTATMTALIENWIRKDAEKREQRRIMTEKLDKYDIVSQLAASVSHEVRNPLTVTRGFLQLLRSGAPSERERQHYISLALDELDRAQDMITDYLSFAKQDPSNDNKTDFDVGAEMEHITNVIRPYALIHSVLVETRLAPACCVHGHPGKFRQCVINLCKNAIEAMPRGGALRVSMERDDRTNEMLLTIQDEGVGMDGRQLERIGTAYATTKEKGTGLGLSVVCRTVEEMGGRIRFRSAVGVGTTVLLHLPLQGERPRQEGAQAPTAILEPAAGAER
ncbi:ATP-binding protein [Paenibacillus sp.]|uniref:ATP-binding protein n=1 Tax=Paenibacillus sp. TaxID=58172 RepID=UPI002810AE00|nr:ATP-binding protein [Paenibacillus sp.]